MHVPILHEEFLSSKIALQHALYEYVYLQTKSNRFKHWDYIEYTQLERWFKSDDLFIFPEGTARHSFIKRVFENAAHKRKESLLSDEESLRASELEERINVLFGDLELNKKSLAHKNKYHSFYYKEKEPILESTYAEISKSDLWKSITSDRHAFLLILEKYVNQLRRENRLTESLLNSKAILRGLVRYRRDICIKSDKDFCYFVTHTARDGGYTANALEFSWDVLFFADTIKRIDMYFGGDPFTKSSYHHLLFYYYTIISKKLSYPKDLSNALEAYKICSENSFSSLIGETHGLALGLISAVASEADWQGIDISYKFDQSSKTTLEDMLNNAINSDLFGNPERQARIHTIYGKHMIKLNKTNKAIKYADASDRYIKKIGSMPNSVIAENHHLRGLILAKRGSLLDANMYFSNAINLHEMLGAFCASAIIRSDLNAIEKHDP